jgi:hypothetical protein
MDTKKYIIASVVVFVVFEILSFIIYQVLLGGAFQDPAGVWRTEVKLPIIHVTTLIESFLFVFIYTKGYEGKGIMEGVRYGLWIGLLMSIPMAFNSFATLPIPMSLAIQWFVYGLIQFIILGVVTAALYKPSAQPATA